MRSIKDVVPEILKSLQNPELKKKNELYDHWGRVVGSKLAGLTKPSLTKEGRLIIWVKDSALAFELNQKFKPAILKRANDLAGQGTVKDIRVRVGQLR